MSAFVLKLLALISMVFDHTAIVFNDFIGAPLLSPQMYDFLRALGRASLPLYAFLITEGFRHTRSAPRYAGRLLAMGAAVQAVYAVGGLVTGGTGYLSAFYLNIMLTLGCGVLLLQLLQGAHSLTGKLVRLCLAGALYAAITYFTPFTLDYGFWALGLIAALSFAETRARSAAVITLWACVFYFGAWAQMACGAAAGLLVLFYNGKKGTDDHHLLYFAYPAHFAPIYGLALLLS